MSDEEKGLYNLSEEVEDIMSKEVSTEGKPQIIEFRDASFETAKVLVPQMGSDPDWLEDGKYDFRRFTNIEHIDVIWLSWFMNIEKQYGGEWARGFCEAFCNFSYSINAQNKKLVVAMQQAVSGSDRKDKKKDTRSFIQRHFTQRGKEKEDEELYDVT